mmetsp:Transcript_52419/g.164655  ORF Transcript_52419/g.164655 Transcript_52419/m.164655 type:complete len:98 (-) Transcript_52419:321-614(-)
MHPTEQARAQVCVLVPAHSPTKYAHRHTQVSAVAAESPFRTRPPGSRGSAAAEGLMTSRSSEKPRGASAASALALLPAPAVVRLKAFAGLEDPTLRD